ncbi:hypothetical protein Hdeb2414_s0154g00815801 [Helianthus debilis subsp. tardiflorus]
MSLLWSSPVGKQLMLFLSIFFFHFTTPPAQPHNSTGYPVRLPARGSTGRFVSKRTNIMNRTGKGCGRRSKRSNRPVRSDLQNTVYR